MASLGLLIVLISCKNKYPDILKNFCNGKEKRPNLVFQCVVDHGKQVMYVSKAFFGATNGKSIFKSVAETMMIMRGSMKEVVSSLCDSEGRKFVVKGAYLSDCGW